MDNNRGDNKKQKKETPGLETVINYTSEHNLKFLEMRRNKFWHLAEEKRRLFTPSSEEDAEDKAFNIDYVQVNNFPPISALRIKNYAGYTHILEQAIVENMPLMSEAPSKDPSNDIDTQDTRCIADQEAFDELDKCTDPHKLMYITDKEQHIYKFTIEEKIGVPMYQQEYKIESEDQSDELKPRVFNKDYVPRRVLAPPEYPFSYYRLQRDQECNFCGKCGKDCHNIRYGMYLCAIVTRYYREYRKEYNEFDAVRIFHDSYKTIAEFEEYLDVNSIDAHSDTIEIPECMAFDSLVFALNSIEWDLMWGITAKSVRKADSSDDEDDMDADSSPPQEYFNNVGETAEDAENADDNNLPAENENGRNGDEPNA